METQKLDSFGEPIPTGEHYGPGKFYTDVDAWLYARSLHDGGGDEILSYDGGGGCYALLILNDEERSVVNEIYGDTTEAVIMFERSDGIVEVEYYYTEKEARDVWAMIKKDFTEKGAQS